MTIILRNLKRSAGGRENIRERDFVSDSLTIGRDTRSDIALAALSVSLNHCELLATGKGRATLNLCQDSRALVNGRLRSGRVKNLKPGAVIRIGPYKLTLEDPTEESHLVVKLEQTEIVTSNIDVDAERAVFSLTSTLPGKRLMAWTCVLVIFGLFLALPIWEFLNPKDPRLEHVPFQTDLAWNSGPLSLAHSNLETNCKTCHQKPFQPVADKVCTDCHEEIGDHAPKTDMRQAAVEPTMFEANLNLISETFGRSVDRCSSCHVEHNASSHILPDTTTLCSDCHNDMSARLSTVSIPDVSNFGDNHPQFRPTIITEPSYTTPQTETISLDDTPKGFSGLKFPHDLHLSGTGGVAQMAAQLPGRYGFDDGVSCNNCHRAEAGGALFEQVNMQQDCAMCHSIVFEDDQGYPRTLRHGEPEEVIASMRDFYQAKALANIRDAEMNSTTRRRPGKAASLKTLNLRELAFEQADERTAVKVRSIFSEGGACFGCHVIDRPLTAESLDFTVRPISISDQFYFKSAFNHESHVLRDLTCETCHSAKTSQVSDDILLPKIDVCQDCHISAKKFTQNDFTNDHAVPTNCLTCHSYHDSPHGQVTKSATGLNE